MLYAPSEQIMNNGMTDLPDDWISKQHIRKHQRKWNQSAIWFVDLVYFENKSHNTIENDGMKQVAGKSLNL